MEQEEIEMGKYCMKFTRGRRRKELDEEKSHKKQIIKEIYGVCGLSLWKWAEHGGKEKRGEEKRREKWKGVYRQSTILKKGQKAIIVITIIKIREP